MSTSMNLRKDFDINAKEFDYIAGKHGFIGKGLHAAFHNKYGSVALKCSEVTVGIAGWRLVQFKIENEIGFLQRANHENIVRLYGWTSWNESISLVMQYLPLGDLKSLLLNEIFKISVPLKLKFCTDILKGLAFLHNYSEGKSLIHGDIKSENILLTDSLGYQIISDFGRKTLTLENYTQNMSSTRAGDSTNTRHDWTLLYTHPEYLDCPGPIIQKYYACSFELVILTCAPLIMMENDILLWIPNIIRGKRFEINQITEQINTLEPQSKNEDTALLNQLPTMMQQCWHQDPIQRLSMIEVRDQFLTLLKDWNSDIPHSISETLSGISVTKSTREDCECVHPDKIFPPYFCLIENLPCVCTSPSSNISTSVFSSRLTNTATTDRPSTSAQPKQRRDCRSSDSGPQQQISLNIERIKEMLKNDQLQESVTQCWQLVTMTTSNIVYHCDVTVENAIDVTSTIAAINRHLSLFSMIKGGLGLV